MYFATFSSVCYNQYFSTETAKQLNSQIESFAEKYGLTEVSRSAPSLVLIDAQKETVMIAVTCGFERN